MIAFATFQKPDGTTHRHFKLDGRSRLEIQIHDCKLLVWRLRDETVYNGFKIYKGDIKSHELILTVVKVGDKWEIKRQNS